MTSGTTRMIATTSRVLTLRSLCWSGLEQAILGEPNDKNLRHSINLSKERFVDPKRGRQRFHSTRSVPKVPFSQMTQAKAPHAGSTEEYLFRQELTQTPS